MHTQTHIVNAASVYNQDLKKTFDVLHLSLVPNVMFIVCTTRCLCTSHSHTLHCLTGLVLEQQQESICCVCDVLRVTAILHRPAQVGV